MLEVTHNTLPEGVTTLTKEVRELKSLFLDFQKTNGKIEPEKFLDIEEASKFLKMTVPTVYSKVSKGELPVMKRGKRLYFSSFELVDFIKKGRKKTNAEIEAEANAYLSNNKKGLSDEK